MAVPSSNSVLRGLVLAGVLGVSVLLAFAGCRHAVAEHWAGSQVSNQRLRAAQLEPTNPENWYRLGRYRQLDFENSDLPLAISYYQRATAIDPRPARYWLDLAEAYETDGNPQQAEMAFREAQQNYPISADVAWRLGNFLVRQGRIDEAFQQIHQAISTDPKLTRIAIPLCWRSTRDISFILQEALPADPKVDWTAIQFFVDPPQPDAAIAVWKRLMIDGPSFSISRVFPLVDMLIGSKRADDSQTVWRQALSAAGIAQPPTVPGSLVWDGGFERPLLNGGLAWRYKPVAGAQLDLDQETVHSGSRSLRIVFDGSQNVDFSDFWQYVIVQPDTRYIFSAYLRAEDLTTDSGLRFEITDANQTSHLKVLTSGATGKQPWTLDEASFTTGPNTRVLRVSLRRLPSSMLVGKIRGSAWVDDVSLVSAAAPTQGTQ